VAVASIGFPFAKQEQHSARSRYVFVSKPQERAGIRPSPLHGEIPLQGGVSGTNQASLDRRRLVKACVGPTMTNGRIGRQADGYPVGRRGFVVGEQGRGTCAIEQRRLRNFCLWIPFGPVQIGIDTATSD
jgi:hypothetical protein